MFLLAGEVGSSSISNLTASYIASEKGAGASEADLGSALGWREVRERGDIQWNLRITDTIGTSSSVHYSEVSFAGRFFYKMLLLHPHRYSDAQTCLKSYVQ